jgi:hypothetical protein
MFPMLRAARDAAEKATVYARELSCVGLEGMRHVEELGLFSAEFNAWLTSEAQSMGIAPCE